MAKITLYESADVYSDGDIENEILRLAAEGFDITRDGGKYPFAVAYHFSPERENILSWYPFKAGASCLEIGAGCGAITGMLCAKCAEVVSVDISKRRSEINYERHKDAESLEIIAGNIQTLDLGRKFDYVVLNGVFEYALSFIHTETPYKTLMRLAKGFLKPDGKLFIAIENRLGLKYFNGAAEDHTDNYFLGLNEYAGNDSVRTFSKEELISLIGESGFKNYRFYYPYPDYKFPSEIFTDSTINGGGCGAPYMNLNKRSFGLYSEQRISAALAAEGIMDRFSNSFLVEITDGNCDESIDYVKINSLRRDEYRIMTVLGGGMSGAFKLPLTAAAENHIKRMLGNENIYPDGIKALAARPYENGLAYPFIKSKSLTAVIEQSKSVSGVLKLFFEKFKTKSCRFYTEKFKSVFGETVFDGELDCISPANIDLISDNIFVVDNGYVVIDNEWVFDFEVPLSFIIWRSLNELYYKLPSLEEKESKAAAFEAFGISPELCETFTSWAVHFADKYVGNNYLSDYACPLNEVSLLALYNERCEERIFSTSCYYDRGEGLSEEDKAFETIELDENGGFSVEFAIPDGVKSFRWDVAEGMFLKCRIDAAEGGVLTPDNATKTEDGYDIFYTTDPHYTLTDFADRVVIRGRIEHIARAEIIKTLEENAAAYARQKGLSDCELAEQRRKIAEQERAAGLDSRYILRCEKRIQEYFSKQVELNLVVEKYQNELAASRAEYDRIVNSKGWRMLSALWNLKGKITQKR